MNKCSESIDSPSSSEEFDAGDLNKLPRGCYWHGATELRAAKKTGRNVRVAVIDAGIDKSHPGFDGKIARQEPGPRPNPPKGASYERTTHLAGTIHFMAPHAKIFDYRVFNDDSDNTKKFPSLIARYISMATNLDNCDVILLPFGLDNNNKEICEAIEDASNKKVHVVCPARPDGVRNFARNVFAVEGLQKKPNLPKIPKAHDDSMVDFCGIGMNESSLKWGGGFFQMTGATVAAAYVTGLIACLLTKSKKQTHDQMRCTLADECSVRITIARVDYGKGIATFLAGHKGVDRFTNLHGVVSDIANTKFSNGEPGSVVQ